MLLAPAVSLKVLYCEYQNFFEKVGKKCTLKYIFSLYLLHFFFFAFLIVVRMVGNATLIEQ